MVREEQLGAAETRIEEIGEEQYSEVETRNDQGSEDLRTDQKPNEESTGELPRYFYGKNRYKWASAEPSRTSRVRAHNIVSAPSQVSPIEFESFTELWKLLFSDRMIEIIVTYTNKKLDSYRAKYKDSSRSELGSTNETEIKALIGLLFYTSVFQSNHENSDFIFATDGTGRDIFRCVMSNNRFLVLLNCLRFDYTRTRSERLKDDKLAAISELCHE